MRWSVFSLILTIAIVLLGCNRSNTQRPADDSSSLDRVHQSPTAAPLKLTDGLIRVDHYQKFPFEVPAHVIAPQVLGEFSSFMQAEGGARITDESADVELMVMTETQCDDFTHKRSAQSVDAVEPSHSNGVKITLPPTHDDPSRYCLILRRASDGQKPVWVNADLRAEFNSFVSQ